MDEEPEDRSAACAFLLDQLVVHRATSEPGGEGLLQHPDQVGVQERLTSRRVQTADPCAGHVPWRWRAPRSLSD
jgi:hypothetical protein